MSAAAQMYQQHDEEALGAAEEICLAPYMPR
jgi:hypothetical protein